MGKIKEKLAQNIEVGERQVGDETVLLLASAAHSDLLIKPNFIGHRYRLVATEYAARQVEALLGSDKASLGKTVLVIDLPRGGLPYGAGIARSLRQVNSREISHVHANTGSSTKVDGEEIAPEQVPAEVDSIIITDSIIGMGTSIADILGSLANKLPRDWAGNILIVVGSSAEEGVPVIRQKLKQLQADGYVTQATLQIAAGRILGEGEHLGKKVINGRETVILGENDAGLKVQGDQTLDQLREMYQV